MDEDESYGSSSDSTTCQAIGCGRVFYKQTTDNNWDGDHKLPKTFFPEKEFLQTNLATLCPTCHTEKTRRENQIRDLYNVGIICLEERQEFFKRNSERFYGKEVWVI